VAPNDVAGWGATVVHDAAAARAVLRHVKIWRAGFWTSTAVHLRPQLLGLLRRDLHWNEPPVVLMSADPHQALVAEAVREGLVTLFLA
jgi:hypothetical protein